MAKQPDPNCKFCRGRGEIRSQPLDGITLPCVCTNEREPDETATGRERVV